MNKHKETDMQKEIESWCRDGKFLHFASKRMDEELGKGLANRRPDPEYEELNEAFEWDDRYAVPLATYLTYRLQVAKLQENDQKRKRNIWWVFVHVAMLGYYVRVFAEEFDSLLADMQGTILPMLHEEYVRKV
ncbi:Uncharacterised protein [Alistipes sp. cv1]|uniref:hypothetical protein n=1 Tax=Alistipes indistinctus TaxID=626932 RepID=UPI0006C31E80|nr:Uncharacterised protein [Faecalibacterium prausnitzii]